MVIILIASSLLVNILNVSTYRYAETIGYVIIDELCQSRKKK